MSENYYDLESKSTSSSENSYVTLFSIALFLTLRSHFNFNRNSDIQPIFIMVFFSIVQLIFINFFTKL